MSHWETINKILKVIIYIFLTLILSELALTYYDFISIKSGIIAGEITFGIILLFGSIIFHAGFSLRKLTDKLMIESITKRPFRDPYSVKQVWIWNDISSNILQEGKNFIPFGIGFSSSPVFLEHTFKRNIADFERRLNTTYKDMVEDEITGNDAFLMAAKKTYEKDLREYYKEIIFDKQNNWEKYGQSLPLDPITGTTGFEENEKRQARIYSGLGNLGVAIIIVYVLIDLIGDLFGIWEKHM